MLAQSNDPLGWDGLVWCFFAFELWARVRYKIPWEFKIEGIVDVVNFSIGSAAILLRIANEIVDFVPVKWGLFLYKSHSIIRINRLARPVSMEIHPWAALRITCAPTRHGAAFLCLAPIGSALCAMLMGRCT